MKKKPKPTPLRYVLLDTLADSYELDFSEKWGEWTLRVKPTKTQAKWLRIRITIDDLRPVKRRRRDGPLEEVCWSDKLELDDC